MKNTFTLFFLCTFFSPFLHAQNGNFIWAKQMGDTSDDIGFSIAVDEAGNVYTTGYFQGTADFDPGPGIFNMTSAGGHDIFISKLNADGNLIWAKRMGSTVDDRGLSIAVDGVGNVYTTGWFQGTADFDPGPGTFNMTSAGSSDIFISKLDIAGNLVWAIPMGGTGSDVGLSIVVDGVGNLYATGEFEGTVDFNPGPGIFNMTALGDDDIFILKLDVSGNLIWAKQMESTADSRGFSIAVDGVGNVYTTGEFEGVADFDPGLGTFNMTSLGDNDIFILKLDVSGNLVWVKQIGSTANDVGHSITVDEAGNVYTTGWFEGTAYFDPGLGTFNMTAAGNRDIFISKLDVTGNLVWAKQIGSTNTNHGFSITVDGVGNVYATGEFEGTADFDLGPGTFNMTSAGSNDIFISKLDVAGNLIWAKQMGGTGAEEGRSIAVDGAGNVHTTGRFRETADFDPGISAFNMTSGGDFDIFISKLSACLPNTGIDIQTACNSYVWMDGQTYISSNTTATHTLTNTAGCDSVVTLHLTINHTDNAVTEINDTTLEAHASGAAYQWLYCDSNFSIIPGATQPQFAASANGNYAVEITQNGCVDTSACYLINSVSILENDFGEKLLIYPNPSDGNFSVDLGASYPSVVITVRDVNGKVVQATSPSGTYEQLFHLKLEEPAGVYFLTVKAGDKKAVVRVLKE